MANTTIKGIAHLALTVRDMEKSLDFYCRVLGFEKAFTTDRDGKPWIVYLKAGESQFFELFYPDKDVPDYTLKSTNNHVCLEVEDIFELEKALDEKGWPIDVRPKQGKDTNWQLWVKDPDGNRIELMQYAPGCPQLEAIKK